MKGTTKIIIAFGVAIAIVATVIVVTVMSDKNDDDGNITPYVLQSTTEPSYDDTDSWININDLANDLVTATDPSEAPETTILPDGSVVIVTTTEPGVSYIYVDQNGNVVDPNDVNNPVTQAPATVVPDDDTTTTYVYEDVIPDDSGDSEVEFSEFEIDSRTGYITKYNGNGGYVSLINQKTINGVEVKGIANGAFAGSAVTYIDIGSHITYIGERAFEGCVSLNSVVFANSSSKVTIGFRAFSGCIMLERVTLPVCELVGQSAFEGCTKLEVLKIPEGTKEIGTSCFARCTSLKSLYIPDSVEVMGKNVLSECDQDKLTVYSEPGSVAEQYAIDAGFKTDLYR